MLLRIGTWQNSDGGNFEVPTNVTRLARSIEAVGHNGTPQVLLFYLQVHVTLVTNHCIPADRLLPEWCWHFIWVFQPPRWG